MLRSMLGPSFDSTLDQVLTQHVLQNLGYIYLFEKMPKPLFYSVFSQKNENFKPTPKNWRTLFVNTTALTVFFSGFSAFLLFWLFAVSVFFGCFFLRGMKKKTKFKTKQQKQKRKKDHKMQTRRPLSLVTKQHRNKIIQMNSLNWKETTQEQQTRTKT